MGDLDLDLVLLEPVEHQASAQSPADRPVPERVALEVEGQSQEAQGSQRVAWKDDHQIQVHLDGSRHLVV